MELSSYQLETIRALSLKSAVITNLSPDHLDRYQDVAAYYDAKWRIVQLVDAEGCVTLNVADEAIQDRLATSSLPREFHFNVLPGAIGVSFEGTQAILTTVQGHQTSFDLTHPQLIGAHNIANACSALAVAHVLGLDDARITSGFKKYAGMPHRMERVGVHNGVVWINDSKATNVDATKTALQSFDQGIHLFAGGVGKGSDYQPLIDAGKINLKNVYVFGEESSKLKETFERIVPVVVCENLQKAVEEANARALKGDVFLLSPACASFDQYRSFEERGDHFKSLFETQRQLS